MDWRLTSSNVELDWNCRGMNVIDIQLELDKLLFLENRSPNSTSEAEDAAFARLGSTSDGDIFLGGFSGQSAWEKHPNGNEIVQVVDGETLFDIIENGKTSRHTLRKGQLVVVTAGCWHRFTSMTGVTLMTVTPLPTETSDKDDPTQ